MADTTITVTNMEFGACQVSYGGTDLGATSGGVTATYTQTFVDFIPDQLSMKTNKFLQTEIFEIVVPLAEYTIDNLNLAIPAGTQTTDGASDKLEFGGGTIASADFKQLILTPVSSGSGTLDTDANMKITLYKAISTSAIATSLNKDGVRTIEITFDCIRDATQTTGRQLGLYGDSTVT